MEPNKEKTSNDISLGEQIKYISGARDTLMLIWAFLLIISGVFAGIASNNSFSVVAFALSALVCISALIFSCSLMIRITIINYSSKSPYTA